MGWGATSMASCDKQGQQKNAKTLSDTSARVWAGSLPFSVLDRSPLAFGTPRQPTKPAKGRPAKRLAMRVCPKRGEPASRNNPWFIEVLPRDLGVATIRMGVEAAAKVQQP